MMYYKEEMNCPLCVERMDWTDQQLKPCDCGYQVCVWCWHQIMDMAAKNETDGRCPACHAPYDKNKIVGLEANFERVAANNGSRKNKQQKARPKTIEGKKDLSNVRVIQRRMAYVIGLPLSLADEDLLQCKEYFGQYGKVCKVSLSRTAGGTLQQFVNDSCSAYITFSTEDEAVRCIQSVHGFVLEGRFLKASFGTAKYCHAWLRNTPCNNSACLYLHSLGAEEDSFSKDEVAAAHTRGRVQQIVGATHNLHRGSGNMLPPPIDEPNNYSATDNSRSDLKDVVPDMEISNFPSLSKDNDGGVREPNNLTTFVDIIGCPDNSDREKDVYEAEDRMAVNLSFDLPLLGINKDNYVEAALSDEMLGSFSSSSPLPNQLLSNKELNEPFREPSNLWGRGRGDLTSTDAFTNKQPDLILDSEKQGSRGALKEGSVSLHDVKLKGSGRLCQIAPLHPSSYPTKTTEDSNILLLSHGESHNPNGYNADESFIPCLNSVNDGSNEKKFQCSAKSDKIYRCSNSFSNEEIVEHLRRLDDGDKTHDAQNSLEAIESSIISDIMSLNFDDDSLTSRCSVTGSFDQTDGLHGSSWNPYNNDKSEFSFVKQAGSVNQLTDLDTLGNTGHHFQKCSSLQDLSESKEHYSCKPQYLVSRTQGAAPPGFSLPLREPPPGFSASDRLDQSFHANSGTHMVKATSFPKNHYRTPSTGNSSNTSDADILDPTIMSLVRGKAPNGLTNSCYDTRSTYALQPSVLDDKERLWLLMQQSARANQDFNYGQNYIQQQGLAAHEDLRYAQTYMEQQAPTAFPDLKYAETYIQQQAPNARQDLKYTQTYRQQEAPTTYQDLKYAQTYMQQHAPTSHRDLKYSQTGMQQAPTAHQEAQHPGQIGDMYSSVDDIYGVSAKYTSLQKQSNSLSSVSPLSQQRFTNGAISNGHQPGLNEMQIRNELQGNERFGFDKFYSGYGEYSRQPSSGDLYTRVFGM